MSGYQHPMRKAVFHAYVRTDGGAAIARAEPAGLCPMIFLGTDAADVLAKAEAFRAQTVADNEAAYIASKETAALAQAAKKAAKVQS